MWPFSSSGVAFDPAKDIPSLKGKVILVTGGNSGLGKQSVLEFARHGEPAEIWLAARTPAKANAAIDEIKAAVPTAPSIRPLELDLASFTSIKAAARTVLAATNRLDILMLNAGVMMTPPGLTASGYEDQFGTNHVGHALLTKLLMPLLLKTAASTPDSDVRVIVLSSAAVDLHPAGGVQFDKLKTKCEDMSSFRRYGQSKLANVLYARELARHYPQLKVAAVHPGAVKTNLLGPMLASVPLLWMLEPLTGIFQHSVAVGAKNQLWAAVAKGVVSGEFYFPVGVTGNGGPLTRDDALANKLWVWTENELKEQSL